MSSKYNEELEKYSKFDLDWKKLKNKKIMLSGATGLIGRYLVDLIMYKNTNDKLNCTIVALCRNIEKAQKLFPNNNKNLIIYKQDVNDIITYPEKTDYVIHAASNTHPIDYSTDPIGTIKNNVFGSYNLLEYSKKNNIKKFVLLSSFEVYGTVNNISKIGEKDFGVVDCTIPRSCYPESKRLSESLAIAYSTQENVNISIVRLSRVFGPTMKLTSSLATAQFIKKALDNENIVLKSDGKQFYSYNYVGDAVTAILTVLVSGEDKEAYNVSHESFDLTLGEFAEIVANYNSNKVIFDLPNDIEKKGFSNSVMTVLNSEKISKLGWKPLNNIKDSVFDTIDILKEMNN